MTAAHWQVLLTYLGFTVIATLLAAARRWVRPGGAGESVWRKYPTYIVINLMFLAASWLPHTLELLPALLAALGMLGAWEISRALLNTGGEDGPAGIGPLLYPAGTAALVALAAWLDLGGWFSVWLAVLLASVAFNTLLGGPATYPRRILAVAACIGYLPLCLAAYAQVQRGDPDGFRAVYLYLTVATNDALAQITGQLLGRHPLASRISPAKTVEGAIGGIVFAGAMGAALAFSVQWNALTGGMIGLVLGIAGLLGDLTASAWKRALGIRNFSALLGAQGGVLDRFDGLVFAAPVFYLVLLSIAKV